MRMPSKERSARAVASASSVAQRTGRSGVRRGPLAALLAALVLLLVATPLLQDLQGQKPIEGMLLTVVLICAMLAVSARRSTLVLAIILVMAALGAKWLNYYRPALMPPEVFVVAAAVFLVFVMVRLLGFILRAPRVDSEVICAGISIYLLLGLTWTLAYLLVAQLAPDAFEFTVGKPSERTMSTFNSIYFSFVTLSTVGYGDIVPVGRVVRMLAIMEAITGTFYMTILIARLVSVYSSEKASDDRGTSDVS